MEIFLSSLPLNLNLGSFMQIYIFVFSHKFCTSKVEQVLPITPALIPLGPGTIISEVFSIPVTIQPGQCSPSLAPSPDTAEHWPIFDTTLVSLEDSGIKTFITKSSYITLKTQNCYDANFVVTGGTGGCCHWPTCLVPSVMTKWASWQLSVFSTPHEFDKPKATLLLSTCLFTWYILRIRYMVHALLWFSTWIIIHIHISHYPNQFWLISNLTLGNEFQWNSS